MHRMETGKQPISLADVAPVARVALVVPEDPVAPVVPENPVVPAARVVPESPAVPVALELQTVPVAVQAPAIARAVRAQLIVRAAGELERGQAVAVPVLGHRHVQPAIPLRTKSVTTAHRPDLVPLLEAEEDLAAAVAETTREPAAAEAVIAWAAAE